MECLFVHGCVLIRQQLFWHMDFYAGRILRELDMANPTVVVLTDRNDLDDRLFGTSARC